MTHDAAKEAVAKLLLCPGIGGLECPSCAMVTDRIIAKLAEMGWKDGATIDAMLSSRLRLEYIGPAPETDT